MSKMMTWTAMMGATILFFYLFGIVQNTGTSTLLDMVLNPERLQQTDWIVKILSVSALVIAVASTFVARSLNSDFALMIPVATMLFGFGWDFLAIEQALFSSGGLGQLIGIILVGPIMLMYTISVLEWWRGIQA